MQRSSIPGLTEFLHDYPLMALRPSRKDFSILRGSFKFIAEGPSHPPIQDAFDLEIEVPAGFPRAIPRVKETGSRIPPYGEYHVNIDGTLCLGSPLRLLLKVSAAPTLSGFAASCLVPYLYAISQKLKHGGPMPFGELAHEAPGLIADYMELFRLKSPEAVLEALLALGTKKRRANKFQCPCGCNRRLGKCKFNHRMRQLRQLAARSWFQAERSWMMKSLQQIRVRAA